MASKSYWYATVDYIRMSWRPASVDDEYIDRLWPRLMKCACQGGWTGQKAERAQIYGYIGQKAGAVFAGVSAQGALLQASGMTAQYVSELCLLPDNVSRIDLQATLWEDHYSALKAKYTADEVKYAFEGRRGRRPRMKLIDGFGEGDTLYVGTRGKRSVYIRLYDKGKESGEDVFDGSWRYEAELSDQYATKAYWDLLDSSFGEPIIARLLLGYLRMRGIDLTLEDEGRGFDRSTLPRPESTTERRLWWLETQVAPSIAKLIADGTDIADVMRVLGLSD